MQGARAQMLCLPCAGRLHHVCFRLAWCCPGSCVAQVNSMVGDSLVAEGLLTKAGTPFADAIIQMVAEKLVRLGNT